MYAELKDNLSRPPSRVDYESNVSNLREYNDSNKENYTLGELFSKLLRYSNTRIERCKR